MAALSFDALPWIVRKHRVRHSRRRRHYLELEALEDRALPSVSAFHPTLVVMHPSAVKPADSPDPWPTAFAPSDIASLYGFDQLTANGTGQTIAIVDAYDNPKLVNSSDANFATSDLHHFDMEYGLPEPAGFFTKVDQNGGTNYPVVDPSGAGNPNGNWEAEEALDVEWAHAIAPMAKIILVEANDDLNATTTINLFKAVAYAGAHSGAQAVSMSWGDTEFSSELMDDSTYFPQPVGYGVTYIAASGDSGAPSLYPAYSPKVISVGGTTLNQDFTTGAYSSEDGWSMSGGGPSTMETQPAYQKGVVPASMSTVGGVAYRTAPDVAFDADPQTGVSMYDSYNGPATGGPWFQIGGTSLGAPAWAGLIALADQLRASKGLGSLNGPSQTLQTLYKLPASDFHDVVTGNNGYQAAPGYDLVTGLGSPVANNLVTDLATQANLQVVDSSPASGASVATSPTTFTITFSDPINPSSLKPSTLMVNGMPASSAALDSTDTIATFTFSTSPVTAQGAQSMTVPAGSVTALGSSTLTNNVFNGTFYYDVLPLAVASTTPAAGTTFSLPAPSGLTYSVTFNEPIDPSLVSTSNLTLSAGTVSAFNVQSGNQTVAYTLTGLTSEGPLRVTIPAGTFKDQYDNPTSPAFTATYYVDNGTVALPPLTAVAPSGSLGYQTTFSSVILYGGDHDQFTVAADPGQLLTVLVKPTSSGLAPTVQLSDPSSAVLGTASGSGPGQNALLQTVFTTTSGTYTITVGGTGLTTGNYTVTVYLDAAVENASQGGASDSTPATAQNLNSAFVTLQTAVSSASRAAVVGSIAQPLTLTASARGQWDSTGAHDATSSAYEVGQVPPTQYRNYFVFDLSNINQPIATATLNLTDVTGGYSSSLSSDTYGLFDVTTPISALVASGTGQAGIFNDLGSGTGYGSQTITTANDGTLISTALNSGGVTALNSGRGGLFAIGGALTSVSGSNTQYLFSGSENASDTTQLVVTLADTRMYSFSLVAGELASVGLKYLTGSGDTLTFQDGTGKTLATGAAGGGSFDSTIANFVAPAAGTYYVVVSGSTAANYNLVVTRDGTLDGKTNSTSAAAQDVTGTTGALGALSSASPTDWYKITLGGSQTTLQLQTATPLAGPSQIINTLNPVIQLYNSTGTLVASGTVLPDGINQSLSATGLTAGATYSIKVSAGSGQGEYYLGIAQPAASPVFSKYLVTAASGASSITDGTSFLLTVQAADQNGNPITSGYSGPASVTATISPSSTSSSFPMTIAIGSNGLGFALANLNTVGTYTITAASGSFTGSAAPLTVTPGPAVKLGFGVQPASTPTGNTLPAVTVQILDQFGNVLTGDNTDQVTLGIASGPGTFKTGSSTTATVNNGVATFNNLTLVTPGSYQLSAIVPGSITGPNSAAFSVVPLQVVAGSFAGTPSGFSLKFNAPFLINSTTPVLYGTGSGSKAPAPSVILTTDPGNLTDTAAIMVGSLILNSATNSLTFLATNTTLQGNNGSPTLPDGVYTVIVRSSAATDGFQAINSGGGFLDGKGTGVAGSGDFTASFTVNAAAAKDDVVWVPATADGPGQALSAPGMNNTTAGFPVYINDSTGTVTHITITLTYDPTLLTVTGVTSNSAIAGSSFHTVGVPSPGRLAVEFNGTTAGAASLKGGQVPLGFIQATVPSGTTANPTPYKAKDLLHLSGVTINSSGSFPVTTSDGLHLVAYVGDANGDGAYSSDDAVKITRVLVQADAGFTAYPLVDPVIVADTDGMGFIPSDAALQANEAGVGLPTSTLTNPPIPAGVHFAAIANNVDPTLTIPANLRVAGDATVTVPVNIDDAHPAGSTGLIAGHLALTYDPSLFTVAPADVHLGSVLAGGGWSLVPTIDQATGQIAIALSGSTPISAAIGGSLVTIDFHQLISGSVATIALASSVSPNGQYVRTELEDAQGTFTLSMPAIQTLVALGTSTPSTQGPINPPSVGRSILVAAAPMDESSSVPLALDETSVSSLSEAGAPQAASVPITASESTSLRVSAVPHSGLAPLAGLLLPSANVPVVNALSIALSAWQQGSEPLFQALGRAVAGGNDPALVGSVQNLERVLAGQRFLSQSALDNWDSLNWQDASLDGQMSSDQTLFGTRRDGKPASQSVPPAVMTDAGEHAALDEVFAQAADDTVPGEDE